MPTFLVVSRHSPENCPMVNEKLKKMTVALVGKLDKLAKKHKVKVVGMWNVASEHLSVRVFEAPSLEAFLKFRMEPELRKFNAHSTNEVKVAMSLKESMKMLK